MPHRTHRKIPGGTPTGIRSGTSEGSGRSSRRIPGEIPRVISGGNPRIITEELLQEFFENGPAIILRIRSTISLGIYWEAALVFFWSWSFSGYSSSSSFNNFFVNWFL